MLKERKAWVTEDFDSLLAGQLPRIFIFFLGCTDFQRGSLFQAVFPKKQPADGVSSVLFWVSPLNFLHGCLGSHTLDPWIVPLWRQGMCLPYPQPWAWHVGSVNAWWWSQGLIPKEVLPGDSHLLSWTCLLGMMQEVGLVVIPHALTPQNFNSASVFFTFTLWENIVCTSLNPSLVFCQLHHFLHLMITQQRTCKMILAFHR